MQSKVFWVAWVAFRDLFLPHAAIAGGFIISKPAIPPWYIGAFWVSPRCSAVAALVLVGQDRRALVERAVCRKEDCRQSLTCTMTVR